MSGSRSLSAVWCRQELLCLLASLLLAVPRYPYLTFPILTLPCLTYLTSTVLPQREKNKANKKVSAKDVNTLRNAFLGGGRPAKRKKADEEKEEETFGKAGDDEFSQVCV